MREDQVTWLKQVNCGSLNSTDTLRTQETSFNCPAELMKALQRLVAFKLEIESLGGRKGIQAKGAA